MELKFTQGVRKEKLYDCHLPSEIEVDYITACKVIIFETALYIGIYIYCLTLWVGCRSIASVTFTHAINLMRFKKDKVDFKGGFI